MGGTGMEIHDGETPPFEDGLPLLRAFIVPADRAVFKGNWDVMGLCGTGSVDYEVPEQFVDSGVTSRALCEVVEIVKAGRMRMGSAPQREQQIFQRDLGIHTVALKAARLLAHESYGAAVETVKTRLGLEPLPF